MTEHLAGITTLILFLWSCVLVWASWQLGRMARSLIEERRELRRWQRLSMLRDIQQRKWD